MWLNDSQKVAHRKKDFKHIAPVASEVYAESEVKAAIVRGVEVAVADVGQAHVVRQFAIEKLILHAAAQTQTAIEALEKVFRKGVLRHALTIVFHLSAHAAGQVAARKGLYAHAAAYAHLVLHEYGHFEVVEVVSKLLLFVIAFAAFLHVVKPRFEIYGCLIGKAEAYYAAHVEASHRATAV